MQTTSGLVPGWHGLYIVPICAHLLGHLRLSKRLHLHALLKSCLAAGLTC